MEKRLAVLGFSALAALVAAVFLGGTGAFLAGGCTAVCFAVLLLVKKGHVMKTFGLLSASLLTVTLAFFVYGTAHAVRFDPVLVYADTAAEIQGVVVDYPRAQYQKYYYEVQVNAVKLSGGTWREQDFRIRLTSTKPLACEPGDALKAGVTFFQYSHSFGLSPQSSYFSKGIALGAYLNSFDAQITFSDAAGDGYVFQKLRRTLVQQVQVLYPQEEAAVIAAMLLGYEDAISPETEEAFRESGTTHLLVVSGMHMALISALVLWTLGLFSLPKLLKNSLAIVALLLFMLLTGMQTSVVRSGITAILWLVADMLGREANPMNSLGAAVLAMCIVNPFIGGDAGFLMSVLATVGILSVIPRTDAWFAEKQKRYPKIAWLSPFYSAICLSFAASLFVLPLQVYLFGKLPVAAPLATVLLTLPSSLLIYVSAGALLFSGVGILAPFAAPWVLLSGLCAKLSIAVAEEFAWLPITQLQLSGAYGMLVLGAGLAIMGLAVFFRATGRCRLLAGGLCVLVLCCSLGLQRLKYRDVLTLALSGEKENTTAVLLENGRAAVLSLKGYNTSMVLEILQENGVKHVEALFLLEDDAKVQEAALRVVSRFPPEKVYLCEDVWLEKPLAQKLSQSEMIVAGAGEESTLLFSGIRVWFSDTGNLRIETREQKKILLEREAGKSGSADLLVTGDLHSQTDSPFTVLQTDDIILEDVPMAGEYMLTARWRIIYIDLLRDGTYKLRGEA